MKHSLIALFAVGIPMAVAAQAPASWQIADAPLVSVGANEEFAAITSGDFFSDGAFVIADARNARLAVFGEDGAPVSRVASSLVNRQWVKLASPRLLMPRPLAVVSLVTIGDSSVFVADSADAPIRELDLAGAERRRFGVPSGPRASSANHIAAYRENQPAAATIQ